MLSLFLQIFPIYISILLGILARKKLDASGDDISRILFFIIAPIIFFHFISHTKITAAVLSLPIITFTVSSILCITIYHITKKMFNDKRANIFSMMVCVANTGYFGLPIAMLILPEQYIGVYVISFLGINFFEATIGYYIVARGDFTVKDAVIKVIRLPMLWAFIGGIIASLADIHIPTNFAKYMSNLTGAYAIIGVMIIGLNMESKSSNNNDIKFVMGGCW